jgi:hypothetical protein
MYIHVCVDSGMYTHYLIHVYVYKHTYIQRYIHTYIHAYTHTHTHTHTHTCTLTHTARVHTQPFSDIEITQDKNATNTCIYEAQTQAYMQPLVSG